ncbi:MAG: PilZ domain-containing protein [Halieaceae bacterium]
MSLNPFPEHAETVTSPARIRQLLERVRDGGDELQVGLVDTEETWRTTISQIDTEAGTMLFGQLTPSTWQKVPGLRQPAEIHCMVKGNRIAFHALLMPAAGDDSLLYLESDIPEQLLHHQLRDQYRIGLAGRESRARLETEDGQVLRGEVVNISAGGCRYRLDASPESLGDPRQLPLCQAHISGLLELEFQARICHVQTRDNGLQVSLAFLELPPGQQRQLQKCLVALERSTMRNRAAVES